MNQDQASEALGWARLNRHRLSARTYNAIVNECTSIHGIKTVAGLIAMRDSEWLRIPNFGRKSLAELRKVLPPCHQHGIDVRGEVESLRLQAERLESAAQDLREVALQMEKVCDASRV